MFLILCLTIYWHFWSFSLQDPHSITQLTYCFSFISLCPSHSKVVFIYSGFFPVKSLIMSFVFLFHLFLSMVVYLFQINMGARCDYQLYALLFAILLTTAAALYFPDLSKERNFNAVLLNHLKYFVNNCAVHHQSNCCFWFRYF